jgi:hypothetical protein
MDELPTGTSAQLLLTHQSRDTVATDSPAALSQVSADSWAAVAALPFFEQGANLDGELRVELCTR